MGINNNGRKEGQGFFATLFAGLIDVFGDIIEAVLDGLGND